MPAVAEELRPQVKWGISRFEHDVVFLHHTQLAESCRGVEGNFGLTQNAPGQSEGMLSASSLPLYIFHCSALFDQFYINIIHIDSEWGRDI